MNEFKKKRDSLERFVKEQIIGPGAYNKKFFLLKNWKDSEFNGRNLKDEEACPALNNISELIPEVPAYQYSSGILFPETKELQKVGNIEEVGEDIDEIESSDENKSADDENVNEDTSESVIRKQQNYPNQLGLSFVVKDTGNWRENLTVSLSFRKYRRIKRNECYENEIAIRVPEYENEIKEAINTYFKTAFKTVEKDGNLFIHPTQVIENETLYHIDYEFLNSYLTDKLIPQLTSVFTGISELKRKDNTSYFGINEEEYSKQFYSIASNKTYSNIEFQNIISLYDGAILNHIKEELEVDISNYKIYKQLIKGIEIYNQLKELVTDLKSILKKGKASPVWESKHFKKEITLPVFDSETNIFRLPEPFSVVDENDDDYQDLLDLKFSVQYLRKGNLNYVKIIIINKNCIDLKANEPPQLNKKDKANEISYFGVELKIVEKEPNCLQQYNPPQLLKIDQEDSFNKLIYRNYINYGEGYNTSVTWGKENALNYIATDFLPSQETPDVGVVPSKIENDKVVKRIEDDQMLSMRYLSTLTVGSVCDKTVLNGLSLFVDAYGGENGWIAEKVQDLERDREKLNDDEAFKLLENQLKACKRDYSRLERNIELLRRDDKAMAAFRTMNTAMFMQLHHSINIKGSQPFIIGDDAEDYYKTVELKTDYKWRSFQLGFILLNIDAFVRPDADDKTVDDVFNSGWPERNEVADLVWFPTGGGKTEAYLGIIAFTVAYRRFTQDDRAYGTAVLMRYTLRMLTLQQFQRATLLICALEAIRKDEFYLPHRCALGDERITIGMFVGSGSLPNRWAGENSMVSAFENVSRSIAAQSKISTNLPFTDCPWCGGNLFVNEDLPNVNPNHTDERNNYGINHQLNIACNSDGCTFYQEWPTDSDSLPIRLFDEDIYKFPPTLLFGTVDKFAALANNISTVAGARNKDSRRLVGKGYNHNVLPPELIIQDELHLLLGPLGSSVGLFEKSIDALCTYENDEGIVIKPKIITSTATTRNTDKQIFALFNRRSEIFPKQGIFADDSFFAFNERKKNIKEYESKRKYVGILPVGKTQVWMQLRIAAITLTHRLKYLKQTYSLDEIFENTETVPSDTLRKVFDYYHTILAYYNSLKDVGKTQSQLSHYLPGDMDYVIKNTTTWSFMDQLIRKKGEINESELTGRLSGEEVKTNLADIEKSWNLISTNQEPQTLNTNIPPEFVIATNMISVGIDVSRFNTMIISSMPRNVAEYIQASSRVARDEAGIVFTVHHPFRSRDISHYQKFKEFHEKFYSYVEPISVTPFASKALDRYLAMYAAVLIRHSETLGLRNNEDANMLDYDKIAQIKTLISDDINGVYQNALSLEQYLAEDRTYGIKSSIDGIISEEEIEDLQNKVNILLENWIKLLEGADARPDIQYRNGPNETILDSLFINAKDINFPDRWKVAYSLRDIGAQIVIKTVQQ